MRLLLMFDEFKSNEILGPEVDISNLYVYTHIKVYTTEIFITFTWALAYGGVVRTSALNQRQP